MSGRGSPSRKLSCSVISGDLERKARPDRNPLNAAADPPASGRCPTARGPSVRRAAALIAVGMPIALRKRVQEMQESEVADQFVKGLDYPVSKNAIVESAREANLSQTIHDA